MHVQQQSLQTLERQQQFTNLLLADNEGPSYANFGRLVASDVLKRHVASLTVTCDSQNIDEGADFSQSGPADARHKKALIKFMKINEV